MKTIKKTYALQILTMLTSLLFISLYSADTLADAAIKPICSDHSNYIKRRLDGTQEDNICEVYKDKVLLIVNTASRCAYTGQYDGLEKLYNTYKDRGLVVLGFPSNDFGKQEPGTEKSIKKFCRLTYDVKFPMYAKTRVIGKDADDLYKALALSAGQQPRWNFHKYLLNRKGQLVAHYNSATKPDDKALIKDIEQALTLN